MSRAAGAVLGGLLLAVGPAGCERKAGPEPATRPADAGTPTRAPAARTPEVAVLTGVAIQWGEGAAPPGVSDEDLSRRIGRILADSPAFLVEGEASPPGRTAVPVFIEVTLHAQIVAADSGGGKARASKARAAMAAVEAELDWKASGNRLEPRENVIVQVPLAARPAPADAEVLAASVRDAVDKAGHGLVDKETLHQADDAAVLRALSGDGAEVPWALELAADRRLAGAFDRAAALLGERDLAVRGAALRFLVALRDPRAVKSLARAADFADADTMRSLIEAVTAIGGPEAVEFLELVASGHSDPDMRQRAQEGLDRLGPRTPEAP
jgi:hypothetical protein